MKSLSGQKTTTALYMPSSSTPVRVIAPGATDHQHNKKEQRTLGDWLQEKQQTTFLLPDVDTKKK